MAVSSSLAVHVAVWLGATGSWRAPPREPPSSPAEARANLTGDTIDMNDEGQEASPGDNAASPTATPSIATAPNAAAAAGGTAKVRPSAGARAKSHVGNVGATLPGKGEGGEAGLFGAVGERGAVDLATAFTRQFPQAASADPVWATIGFGSAGEADATLVVDAAGKLVGTTVSSGAPAALKNGVLRTVGLLGGRPFTAQGARTRLHVRATVSHDQVHDGLHGDVFAIGGSFSRTEGSAFFALAIGRRVDFRVTALRIGTP